MLLKSSLDFLIVLSCCDVLGVQFRISDHVLPPPFFFAPNFLILIDSKAQALISHLVFFQRLLTSSIISYLFANSPSRHRIFVFISCRTLNTAAPTHPLALLHPLTLTPPFFPVLSRLKGVGEGGGAGGAQVGLCPPPLLGRPNVLSSLFAHILWLKTQFFKIFLARFTRQL